MVRIILLSSFIYTRRFPVDTRRKLNVHKTFRRRPGRLLNVLCTFVLCLLGCAIWYNLKNVKTPYMVKVKVTLLHGCFSRFLNCTNGTKSRKASYKSHYNMENAFIIFLVKPVSHIGLETGSYCSKSTSAWTGLEK